MFRVRKASLLTLAAVFLVLGTYFVLGRDAALLGVPTTAIPAPALRLVAPDRGPVALGSYRGDVVLLTFGRPSCGTGCNPQLATLTESMARLGDQRRHVRVLFASLEPDVSEQALLDFVQDHDPGFTGLRGDGAAARELEATYRAAVRGSGPRATSRSAAPDPGTAWIYGIDPNGTLRVAWSPGQPDALARDVRILLRY